MANSSDPQSAFVALEQQNLMSSNAEYGSAEMLRSFPPPNPALVATASQPPISADRLGTAGTVMDVGAEGDTQSTGGERQLVAQRLTAPAQQVRHYESTSSNTWQYDTKAGTNEVIYYNYLDKAQLRAAFILASGDWEEVGVQQQTYQGRTIYVAVKKGRRTINNFIRIVRRLERAYPDSGPADIIEMLRAIAGYNNNDWRVMMGRNATIPEVQPVGDILTDADIDVLRAMSAHGEADTAATERGVVRDNNGSMVGMGHVITGLASGYHPMPNVDPRDGRGALGNIARGLGQGSTVNNLYATTIAGDLGQEAVIQNRRGSNDNSKYIGDGTEATMAEVIGDVDGFNLGHMVQQGQFRGLPISQVLQQYYQSSDEDSRRRWSYFQQNATDLQDQTARFANNFRFTGSGNGITANVTPDVNRAVNQMNGLVNQQANDPNARASSHPRANMRWVIRTEGGDLAYLVSDPNRYEASRIASLGDGVRVWPHTNGAGESFNTDLAEPERYGFSYVMVTSGGFEGQMGWVSNSFLRAN